MEQGRTHSSTHCPQLLSHYMAEGSSGNTGHQAHEEDFPPCSRKCSRPGSRPNLWGGATVTFVSTAHAHVYSLAQQALLGIQITLLTTETSPWPTEGRRNAGCSAQATLRLWREATLGRTDTHRSQSTHPRAGTGLSRAERRPHFYKTERGDYCGPPCFCSRALTTPEGHWEKRQPEA